MCDALELGIIGMGPSGIGIAMSLQGTSLIGKTVCFEQGFNIGEKNCALLADEKCCRTDPCHVISGIGGSSNNSSGKISDFPAGSGLVTFFGSEQNLRSMMSKVISTLEYNISLKKFNIDHSSICYSETFYRNRNIQFKYYDVYEFEGEKYRSYVSTNIKKLMDEGLKIETNAEVTGIEHVSDVSLYRVTVRKNNVECCYYFGNVVIATGSIRICEKLISNLCGHLKTSFEIGVRVEGLAHAFNQFLNTHGDLKLKYNNGRTYCATKNGRVISYRTDGMTFLEGYIDDSSKTLYSNLAVLIKCDNESILTEFLNRYEAMHRGLPIKQEYSDYMANRETRVDLFTTLPTAQNGNIAQLFPDEINQSIRDFLKHVLEEAMQMDINALTLIAPELKILRDIELSTQFEILPRLFVVGAASGKFRGILQSICSGLRCGQNILARRKSETVTKEQQ